MGLLFQRYRVPHCCLCREKGLLTGEHKIKASMLRQEFGKDILSVHRNEERPRIAQSVKSKHLKFEAKICQACNGARTQQPDLEFDSFSKLVLQKIRLNQDPKSIWDDKKYAKGSPSYLNLFRYFAKILCCQLAEIDAPIPKRLAQFAICKSRGNYIWLDIRPDSMFEQLEAHMSALKYAAHGGLLIHGFSEPTAFYSTITLGPLQYAFFMNLAPVEILELKWLYREFYNSCCTHLDLARETSLPDYLQSEVELIESTLLN